MKANLNPVKRDKRGELFDSREVTKVVVNSINQGIYFSQRTIMSEDMKEVQAAEAKIDAMIDAIGQRIDRLNMVEGDLSKKTKAIGGNVRDSAEKLAQGLAKVEKAANFDRLERMVNLLERAAAAMSTLAELEKGGKLERIATAIK